MPWRSWRCLLALSLWLAAATGAWAQDPNAFCYDRGTDVVCRDTLDQAEAAMRASPENAAIAELLKPAHPNILLAQHSAQFSFVVRDQPGVLHAASYRTGLADGDLISGGHGCTPGSDPHRANWCADEAELVDRAMAKYRALYPACTFSSATPVDERIGPYAKVEGLNTVVNTYGLVRYGDRRYRTLRTCATSVDVWHFRIEKEASFTCAAGYTRLGDAIANDGVGDLTLPVLCGYDGGTRTITGPIRQVASCKASPNPCYPATGDKARGEPDFEFAGRVFARHYHSLRQFRNNPGLAVGWTHTFSDRVHGIHGASPAAVIDETGHYESFTAIGGNRYRGDNSIDKRLESFASGQVRWRLRLAGGEIREFDASRRLIAVRDADDPGRDVVLGYANDLLAAATDARGRALRFEYDGAKRMTRILLPDGTAVRYGYDAEDRLTSVEYGDGRVRRYHYAESGLIGDPAQRYHLTGITLETEARYASFRYDALGRVIESRVFGTPNEATTVSYDSDTVATVVSAAGEQRVYTLQPGLYRRVAAVQTAGEPTRDRQQFDASGRLQRRTNRLDVHTDYEYHPTDASLSATVEAVGRPEQRREEVVRDSGTDRVTALRTLNAAGVLQSQQQWTYNPRGQVSAVTATDPSTAQTRTTAYAYCEQADVDAGTCPQVGLPKSVDGPRTDAADVVGRQYRVADHPDCATAPTTCPWRRGDPWKTTNALGQTVEILAHDGAGRVRSLRDANGVITDIEYDPRGRPLSIAVRGIDSGSESDDRIVRMAYWSDGMLKQLTQPDGGFLLFDYDDARRLTTIADAAGNAVVYTLDGAGERTMEETFDATGTLRRTLARTYDTLGRLVAVRDARAQTPNGGGGYLYPATMQYGYDAGGRLESATDALGRRTEYRYDALDRLIRSLQNATAAVGASDRAEIGYAYDALDRPTQVIDPKGLVTGYAYDAFGDLRQQTSPDTGTTVASYDSAGNPLQTTDADGRRRTMSYDALGRIAAVTYPQDATLDETYLYDIAQPECPEGERFLVGRLARMSDGSGSTTYCYNRFGDLVRKVQVAGGRTFVLRWVHAANGRRTGMIYPDGTAIEYVHDAQGRIVAIDRRVESYRERLLDGAHYAPFGPVVGWTYGNGLQYRRTLNPDYRPGVVEDGPENGSGPGISLGYEFDAAGNLAKLRNGKQDEPPQRIYGYDGLGRLVDVRDAAQVQLRHYDYDATGNRTSSGRLVTTSTQDCSGTMPGEPCVPGPPRTDWVTRTYTPQPQTHRLWTVGNTERRYDAAGNTIWIGPRSVEHLPAPDPGDPPPPEYETESAAYAGTQQSGIGLDDGEEVPPGIVERTFAYDAANRLAAVHEGGNPAMAYRYNGIGERVYRSGSGQTAYTVFDEAGQWLGDYDENGQALQQAIWLNGLPVGLLAKVAGASRMYYVEPDALGSPRAVIDPTRGSQGTAVWRWALSGEPFGEEPPDQDPDGDTVQFVLDLRFPGQQYDSASGLNYNYFRDYDPSVGRYVQSDPIGLAGGVNTYGYVGGNPLLQIDPLGLDGANFYSRENLMPPPKPIKHQDISDAKKALAIMGPLSAEMKSKKIHNVDQFYHCLAACRATKATGNMAIVIELMNAKEATDWWRWRFGVYAKDFDASEKMQADNAKDRAVNLYGASCPPGTGCVNRCRNYLDLIPASRRAEMSEYVPEWSPKGKKK